MWLKVVPSNQATEAAQRTLDGRLTRQATLLSYRDVFLWVGVFFLVCVPFVLLFIKNARSKVNMAEAMH